jgi:hypothetical protein
MNVLNYMTRVYGRFLFDVVLANFLFTYFYFARKISDVLFIVKEELVQRSMLTNFSEIFIGVI